MTLVISFAVLAATLFIADVLSHSFWMQLIVVVVTAVALYVMQERFLPPAWGGRRGEAPRP